MPQEQLTLLVAGIGLAGVVAGGLIGFFAQKWQFSKTSKKESLVIVESRLKEIEDYFDEAMKLCQKLLFSATELAKGEWETDEGFYKLFEPFRDDFSKLGRFMSDHQFILMKVLDEKIQRDVLHIQTYLMWFVFSASIAALQEDVVEQHTLDELVKTFVILQAHYGELVTEIDEYRFRFYGISTKRNLISSLFRRKKKSIAESIRDQIAQSE